MIYGQIIAELLKRKEWTQEKLAEKSGYSRGTISRIISGAERGTCRTFEDLLDAMNIPIEECLALPPDPKSEEVSILHRVRQAYRAGGRNRARVLDLDFVLRHHQTEKTGSYP
jgi:transcriptional regulator with XRE-family HTH domain